MGFWDTSVQVVGLQSIPLLTESRVNPELQDSYSISDETAKFQTILNYPGMDNYIDLYMVGFRRKYREAFSADILENLGFPIEVQEVKLLDNALYLAWIASSTTPAAVSIRSLSTGALNPFIQAKKILQDSHLYPIWSNNTNILTDVTIGDYTGDWLLVSAENVYIQERIFGMNYTLESLSGHPTQSNIAGAYLKNPPERVTIAQYISALSPTEYFLDFRVTEDIPDSVWTFNSIDISPVIPIKEDGIMNVNEREVINVLDELGVGGEGLWDQMISTCPEDYVPPVDDPYAECDEADKIPSEIDNAYVMTGVSPMTDDAAAYPAVYFWFDVFATMGDGTFSFSIDALRMSYDFDITKLSKVGTVGIVHTATLDITSEEMDAGEWGTTMEYTMTLKYQYDQDNYYEIVVTNFNQQYTITRGDDWIFSADLGWDPDDFTSREAEPRLITTMDSYNNMDYDHWVPLHETGMILVAFSYSRQSLKWYQTGVFKIIIMVVSTWLTGGFANGFVQGILAAVQSMIVAMMVSAVGTILASMTDSQFLQFIIYAIVAVSTLAMGGFDFNSISGFDGFMKMANVAVNAYNNSANLSLAQWTGEMEEKINELNDEEEELSEELRAMEGINSAIYIQDYSMDIASEYPDGMINPEEYYYEQTGQSMFNVDNLFDVDAVYAYKKNVKT